MAKKILLLLTIVLQFALTIFSLIIFINRDSLQRDVYLDFSLTSEMIRNFKGKKKMHAFSASANENYALYSPKEKSNSLENVEFYGDIQKYNYLNNNYSLDIWENDFDTAQIILLVNEKFDSLEISLNNENNLPEGLEINYGFNEFIYSSDYYLTGYRVNPFGINETLLVPEKITENKILTNVYKDRVYIINLSVFSKTLEKSEKIDLDFKIVGKIAEKEEEIIHNISLNLFDINYDAFKKAEYNTFYFPEWTSFYYNSVFNERNDNNNEDKYYGTPEFIEYELDFDEYIDFNWDMYWKNEYEGLAKIGMDSFQLRMSDLWNSNWNDEIEFHNPWKIRRKALNFIPWRYKGNQIDIENIKAPIKFEDIDKNIYIADEDWDSFDKYLNLLAEVGMKKGMLNSAKTGWGPLNNTLKIYDESTKKYFEVNSSANNSDGINFLNWWFNQFKKHIDDKRPKWFKDIKLYYYLDELDSGEVKATNNWLKAIDPNKEYLGMAFSDWERDIDYKRITQYDHADYAWVHFLDIYNDKNKNYMNFKEFRNKKGLYTGEYFLDSDSTFNLTRAEPGILGYMQAVLKNQGDPYFMKYALNGWEEGKSAWSSDFKDYSFIDLPYVSGDTIFSYPELDTIKNKAEILSRAEKWNEPKEKENFQGMAFNPSTRLLQLSVGTNYMNKIDYLMSKNFIPTTYLSENLDPTLKLGKKLSNTKFDLKYDKVNFPVKLNGYNLTSLEKYLKLYKKYDEIQGYKNIINKLKIATRIYLGGI
ncbi:hypothetical protein [Spiroplasma diminutum]|uniref:Glycoside hydrolase 123 C-terminal domain-containing protein n=1 Tax=Spiroplasma diminutum CUAS-1 TaxID=1276221 RepID=S5MDZ4_9MOLU|nr:hypothetical protein [Spiroplasma diminutum]AGR41943.1 hypothetical protein SDIMI_v3c02390 [Spiroplasma diminutum CUAS-1]